MSSNRTIFLFLIARMVGAALVVGAGITIIQVTNSAFAVRTLYTLLALSIITGGACYAAIKLGVPRRHALWVIMVLDIALEATIIHFSGGMASQFSMIYCLTIVAAAFLLELPGGLVTAVLGSAAYILYGIGETLDIIVPAGRELSSDSGHGLGLLEMYMHVTLFFLVGTMGGYLAKHIRLKGHALESAEIELKQLKVDTDYILNNMSSGILVIDSNTTVISMNPAAVEILGVERDAVLGNKLEPALQERAPELVSDLLDALDTEQGKRRHEVMMHVGEKITPLGTSISLLSDSFGETRGLISVFQDLTEVQEMRERVRKADRLAAIGELSAGIAHELRNPLASISGSIEMLAGELEVSGEHEHLMQLIIRESDRLDSIISDFLDFAKLRTPVKRPMQLERCLSDVLMLLRNNTGKSAGMTINLETPDVACLVRADDDQMRQVFTNLAINACEAVDGSGELTVSVIAPDDATVEIAFRDNGPGIGEEEIDRLFEPFFTTKDGGTGLGLAIANKIVQAHGGSIEFHNGENGGAEFKITLPTGRAVRASKPEPSGSQLVSSS